LSSNVPKSGDDPDFNCRQRSLWSDQALAVFREQMARHPQDERTAARVSEAFVELMKWNDLRDFLEPRVNRTNPPLWAVLEMAEALPNLNELTSAIQLLTTAEKSNFSNKSIHYRLLMLYRNAH
jgi:hypothetical protein